MPSKTIKRAPGRRKARAASEFRQAVGRRILALIEERYDGNYRGAAMAMGLDHSTLWRSANGIYARMPSPLTLLRIAQHFGVTVDSLLVGEPAP